MDGLFVGIFLTVLLVKPILNDEAPFTCNDICVIIWTTYTLRISSNSMCGNGLTTRGPDSYAYFGGRGLKKCVQIVTNENIDLSLGGASARFKVTHNYNLDCRGTAANVAPSCTQLPYDNSNNVDSKKNLQRKQ